MTSKRLAHVTSAIQEGMTTKKVVKAFGFVSEQALIEAYQSEGAEDEYWKAVEGSAMGLVAQGFKDLDAATDEFDLKRADLKLKYSTKLAEAVVPRLKPKVSGGVTVNLQNPDNARTFMDAAFAEAEALDDG